MKQHQNLLNKIEAHRAYFIPSKQEYLNWVFRYNCRFLELHDINPSENTALLNDRMTISLKDTFDMVRQHYWTDNRLQGIYVPLVEQIDECLRYDIDKRGLSLESKTNSDK